MNPVSLQSIKLSKDTLNVLVGGNNSFTVTVSPYNALGYVLEYTSSDTSVAKVQRPGTVTGVNIGTAIITVKNSTNTISATCVVNVQGTPVSSIKLNKTSATIYTGTRDTLTATVLPSNATSKNITWRSSDTAVVKVDANGIITANRPGPASVTASVENGKISAICSVLVLQPLVTGQVSYIRDTVNNISGESVSFKFANGAPFPVQILEWYVSDSNGKKIGDIAGSPIVTLQPHAVYNSPVQFFESSVYASARGGLSVCPLTVHFVYNGTGTAYNMVFTYPIGITMGL